MNKKIRLIIYSSILVIGFISLIVQLLSNQYEQIKLVSIKNVNVEKIILENINNSFSLEGSEKDYFLNEFKKPGVIAHHSAPRRALNNLYLTVNVKIMFKDRSICFSGDITWFLCRRITNSGFIS